MVLCYSPRRSPTTNAEVVRHRHEEKSNRNPPRLRRGRWAGLGGGPLDPAGRRRNPGRIPRTKKESKQVRRRSASGETAGAAVWWKGGRGEAAGEERRARPVLGMAHPERCAIRIFFM